jgi:hypothetical protein
MQRIALVQDRSLAWNALRKSYWVLKSPMASFPIFSTWLTWPLEGRTRRWPSSSAWQDYRGKLATGKVTIMELNSLQLKVTQCLIPSFYIIQPSGIPSVVNFFSIVYPFVDVSSPKYKGVSSWVQTRKWQMPGKGESVLNLTSQVKPST